MKTLRSRTRALRVLAVLATLFLAVTARVFIWPDRDDPEPVDAIVMYAGSPGRFEKAVELARAGYAPMLAVSTPSSHSPCPEPISGVQIICFRPEPVTTRGEARMTAELADRYGWRSVLIVVSTPQDSRARLRLGRCYDGRSLFVTVPPVWHKWPYGIAYEWAASVKALTLQRSC